MIDSQQGVKIHSQDLVKIIDTPFHGLFIEILLFHETFEGKLSIEVSYIVIGKGKVKQIYNLLMKMS